MRWRPWLWLCVSVLCFFAAAYFWRLGDEWAAQKRAIRAAPSTNQAQPAAQPARSSTQSLLAPMRLLSAPGNLNSPTSLVKAPASVKSEAAGVSYRLSNNQQKRPLEFARDDHSILLDNALIDTTRREGLPIPEALKSHGDPGSYIVQARGPIDAQFRLAIKNSGAEVVAYIPNNAYLVRGSQAAAQLLESAPETQAVLPYEPYYKLKPSLLKLAMEQTPLPRGSFLSLLLFSDARQSVLADLQKAGTRVVGNESSPFGPVLKVYPGFAGVAALAAIPGVQAIEMVHSRQLANDLSRVALGVAPDSVTTSNYFGLTGTNIVVNVNDTGVDTNHLDLKNRVAYDVPTSGVDSNGHGTHVAGIIAGDGSQSTTVSNAQGSVMPPSAGQFRGKAPGAKLFSMDLSGSDQYLQEQAARTNALISNNSWTYGTIDYDLAAASFDAAVRDSLPTVTGPQAITYVFPTGNGGDVNRAGSGANDSGTGGIADSIRSPGVAKNVITVGAVEQIRNITNEVTICTPDETATNGVSCQTNIPWMSSSDSSNQVTSYSGRGNSGIMIDGDFGRFKPDVVAPGAFVVSTRSGQWNEKDYYNSTDYSFDSFPNIQIDPASSFDSWIYVPANAIQLGVQVTISDIPTPLPITLTSPTGATVTDTSILVPPMGVLAPTDDIWVFSVSNNTANSAIVFIQTFLVLTNDHGNYFQVLSNMNNELGPYYRYESGSSMAAAEVSGTLALMHEFFQKQLKVTNSPALMKALLINGARSLGSAYNFQVRSKINYQGWGQVQLPNSIPVALTNLSTSATAASPLYFFDQNPTNALVTGQKQTRNFSISPSGMGQDLRVTVVWTDPPGNPAAGIKLVNDLDLVVTNLDNGEVFYGNDIVSGSDYNQPWDTNETAKVDFVNNVENVYVRGASFTNFSVTVIGHRVNVNAVSGHPDNVAQDYALVVSSGNGLVPDALQIRKDLEDVFATSANVTWVTNMFPNDVESPVSGGYLTHQHVGANTPLLGTNTLPLTNSAGGVMTSGMTNQWHFYVISNDFNFTNASFVTMLPPNLAVPRMGVNTLSVDNATRPEADIDMYVSTESGLTNLDPGVLLRADKSVKRGGTEYLVYSNAAPGAVYYIGIKSEDQMAAEYEFLAVFSLFPPGSSDSEGNIYLRGIPVPSFIPPGTPRDPTAATVLGINVSPMTVRRVIVTNNWNHTMPGSLLGNLSHTKKFAVLNNHTCFIRNGDCSTNAEWFYYEDNGEGNVLLSRPSDGPGSLKDFMGEDGMGIWRFDMVNNFPAGTGSVNRLFMKLEPQNLDTNGVIREVLPQTWTFDSIEVPADATNLTICVSGNSAMVELYVQRDNPPSNANFDYYLPILPPGDCLEITTLDTPPLVAGRYYIGVFNSSTDIQRIRITAQIFKNPYAIAQSLSSFSGQVPIADDAVTLAYITNSVHMVISALDVGLLIHHPRISDLAITLVSPKGTRVLLFEDRGAVSTNGLGTFSALTNGPGMAAFGYTNMTPFYTNNFDGVPVGYYSPGAVFDGWNVLGKYALVYPMLPAPWLSNNVLVLADAIVSTTLPTTNSLSYALSYKVTHAPFLTGTIAWWPLDEDGRDMFGGFDGLLSGDVSFGVTTGMVNQAFFGDGVATRMMVPRCPDIDAGQRRGFTIEGWVRPRDYPTTPFYMPVGVVAADGFENDIPRVLSGIPTGSYVSGWLVETGSVDLLTDNFGFYGLPDEGLYALELNGNLPGAISRNFTTVPGSNYVLSFAFSKNPTISEGLADLGITGLPVIPLRYTEPNSFYALNWAHTSIVFTATSPSTTVRLASRNRTLLNLGMYLDSFVLRQAVPVDAGGPLVEWYDASAPTNDLRQGLQLWYGGLPGTNNAGALMANFWDTNSEPHVIGTAANVLTNGGWQHIALTYNAANLTARLYTNGQLAASQVISPTNIVPRTSGDLFLGYHPGSSLEAVAFNGGLDEFGLYARPLWDKEILAIYDAGVRGKYGTNVLRAPVTNSVQLITSLGATTYTFTNGLSWWTNGPQWETNIILFDNLLGSAFTNGPATNFTALILSNPDENAAFDDFVLSSVQTNYFDGQMHFTENTNLARIPVKFAGWPYVMSNFPPSLIFSNEFELATQAVYQVGSVLPGSSNNPAFGPRDWTVISGPVTVISNTLVDAIGSNAVALGGGGIQCALPTEPGHRYEVSYSVRGPGAVSWWTGDIDPLSQRAWDVLGGNDGTFAHQATNSSAGLVNALGRTTALFFPGIVDPTNGVASKIDIGDPANLRLTNGFTIEGWVQPVVNTNLGVEQILFRGDSRTCSDPYYLALRRVAPDQLDILFHIESEGARDCGVTLSTVFQPVNTTSWQHIAAVFEPNITLTNGQAWPTNQLRIYLNGRWLRPEDRDVELFDSRSATLWNDMTGRFPFRDLDPAFRPGVSIGNRSRMDDSEPFNGFIDELAVYGRALTGPEIGAIAAAGRAGKADFRAQPELSLAKVSVRLDNIVIDTANGNNSQWTTRAFLFTADKTNLVLTLQSLLPGTIVDGITMTELPAEMDYLPEQPLSILNGEDAYGIWTLEIWDTRAGGFLTNDLASLMQWELNFVLPPSNAPPVINLVHGIPYTNSLPAHGIQNFVVNVPQWATNATNVLLFASDRTLTNPQLVDVFFDLTNRSPLGVSNALFTSVFTGVTNLATNIANFPYVVPAQPYYLTVTNPNAFAITFAYGVWFDITSLTNCQPLTNFVWQAGIPRYYQFEVPTNALPPDVSVSQAFLYLTGVESNYTGLRSNLTVVVSQSLPLPDLTHFDYMSRLPSTNEDIVMVLTNTTPFPIQSNRWYVGVFSDASTNIPFVVQACYTTSNYPLVINLTNGVPFTVADVTNRFIAPPGPPRSFFFALEITNYVDGVLFELYNLSGDADLVLERDIPPAMAPYFAASYRVGRAPEQIVVRSGFEVPDLRGKWYLGIFNNLATNVAYSIRAVVQSGGLLNSALPQNLTQSPMSPPHQMMLQWNSVMGEYYQVEFTPTLFPQVWTPLFNGLFQATTPLSTFEVPTPTSGMGFYRVVPISRFDIPPAPMRVVLWSDTMVRISWSTSYPGQRLFSSNSLLGPWVYVNQPVVIEGNEFVVYDFIGTQPKYYRLMP